MAQQQGKKQGSIAKQFRAALQAGRMHKAAELLQVLADDLTDGYVLLDEERAAELALKPTRAFKEFLTLFKDKETVMILLTLPLGLAQKHPTLAVNMSRVLACSPHFSKPTGTLLKCGALSFLAEFLAALPPLIDQATRPPYGDVVLSIASNLIATAITLHETQVGFDKQLLRAGVLEALLNAAPFKDGQPDFSLSQLLAESTLMFVSQAVYLCADLSFARRVHKGEGIELPSKIVHWSQNLLDLVCAILEAAEYEDQLANLLQTCIDGVLELLRLVGKGFPGAFDFWPSIRRVAPHLERFPGDRAQNRWVIQGLERASKADAAGGKRVSAELQRFLVIGDSTKLGFLTFRLMRKAFASSFVKAQIKAIVELATFFHEQKGNPDYRQANLHKRRSLFPLVPQILGLLEDRSHADLESAGSLLATTLYVLSELIKTELARVDKHSGTPLKAEQLKRAAVRLLTWLKMHHTAVGGRSLLFMVLTTVGQCARATWASLAAILNGGGFLVFCKAWFEANAQRMSIEETEEFAECLLAPLRGPRGLRVGQTAIREALTRGGMLKWVFELTGGAADFKFDKRPDLLPLLALCSEIQLDFSAFITPELLHLFVRQLRRNWRGWRAATLPTFEEDDVMLRSMGEELNRLAGLVRIVEAALCGSRRDASGKWDPGYLADVRAAVADGAHRPMATNFITFCEAEGAAVFASMVEERGRLERFRVRAEREGYLLPEAADVAQRVEAVWELVAATSNLHKCANQACSRVEDRRGAFMRCGGCKFARYCAQRCQKAHWRAGHERECRISR